MADSNFNEEKFLRELAERSGIYTGAPQIQDRNVPVNVDTNEWRLGQLNQQLQDVGNAVPVTNLTQTNKLMVGGELADSANYRPPVPEVAAMPEEPVLTATTNTPSVPVTSVPEAPLNDVPPSESLARQEEEYVAAPPPELPEVTVTAEPETEGFFQSQMESLSSLFKKHMSKVQKVQFGKLNDDQKSDIRLRFYLRLMEEGGKRNRSDLVGNIGIAGRDALDAKRIILEESNKNELARYNIDAKEVFNVLTMEAKDRSNKISARRWDIAAKSAANKIRAGQMKTIKGSAGWELCDIKVNKCEPLRDSRGKQLQHDASDGRNLTGDAAVIDYLLAGGDKGKQTSRMGKYKEILKAKEKSGAAAKDESWKQRHERSKAITDIVKKSCDEFGQNCMSREDAERIYHKDNPMEGLAPAPVAPAEAKRPTGADALEGLPDEAKLFANGIKIKIDAGEMSREQGIAELKERYPDIF